MDNVMTAEEIAREVLALSVEQREYPIPTWLRKRGYTYSTITALRNVAAGKRVKLPKIAEGVEGYRLAEIQYEYQGSRYNIRALVDYVFKPKARSFGMLNRQCGIHTVSTSYQHVIDNEYPKSPQSLSKVLCRCLGIKPIAIYVKE